MKILETADEANAWIDKNLVEAKVAFVIPIFADLVRHPAVNKVSVVYVRAGLESVLLPFNHMDALCLPPLVLNRLAFAKVRFYTPFKKDLLHAGFVDLKDHIIDAAAMEYAQYGTVTKAEEFYPALMQQLVRRFGDSPNLIDAIPLLTLGEWCDAYSRGIATKINGVSIDAPTVREISGRIIPVLFDMEKAGIHVDEKRFTDKFGTIQERHIVNGCVHTRYNPYTTTGRIASSFAGVPFAALNKRDGTRKAFTSRFNEEGRLVLIDFESFHLRLMADAMNFDLPKEPVHEYLAKQYFGTETFTPEQYTEGKQVTFQLLYGDEQSDVDIPFIQAVYKFTASMWEAFKSDGYIQSPTGRRITKAHIEEPTPAKLFNYFLQLREMEVAIESIKRAKDALINGPDKIVLYTYDSILIDCWMGSGSKQLFHVCDAMSQQGKFPVRMEIGANYDEMRKIKG